MTVSYFFTGSPSGTEGTTEDDVAEEDGEGLSEGNEDTAEDGTFSLLQEHTERMSVSIRTIDNIFFISNKKSISGKEMLYTSFLIIQV
jgi:hypothetical protein